MTQGLAQISVHSHGKEVGLAKTVYMYVVYDRIYDEISARNTEYTPYMYGSGQPYK
jgi:hypothetical protein